MISPTAAKKSSRRDKSPLEIEFEQNQQHCTFQPNLQKKTKKATHKPKQLPMKPSLPRLAPREIEDMPTPFVRAVESESSPDKEEGSELTISPNH